MKYPEIAKRFAYIMNLRGVKAVDIAQKTDISAAAISHYCNGNRCPSTDIALKIGKALNCNPIWLMDLDDRMEITTFAMTNKGHDIILIDDDMKLIIENIKKLPEDSQNKLKMYIRAMIDSEKTDK